MQCATTATCTQWGPMAGVIVLLALLGVALLWWSRRPCSVSLAETPVWTQDYQEALPHLPGCPAQPMKPAQACSSGKSPQWSYYPATQTPTQTPTQPATGTPKKPATGTPKKPATVAPTQPPTKPPGSKAPRSALCASGNTCAGGTTETECNIRKGWGCIWDPSDTPNCYCDDPAGPPGPDPSAPTHQPVPSSAVPEWKTLPAPECPTCRHEGTPGATTTVDGSVVCVDTADDDAPLDDYACRSMKRPDPLSRECTVPDKQCPCPNTDSDTSCTLKDGTVGKYGMWSEGEECKCVALNSTTVDCPNVGKSFNAVIRWDENNVPSLCPDTSLCGGVAISPEHMDKLAEQVLQGGEAETNAIKVLDDVGERYITKVVKNQSNKCKAYPDEEKQVQVFWKPCSGTECSMTTSSVFGRKELKSTKGCGWWGRGVIQTSGPCNFGKLNKALAMVKDKDGNTKYKFNLCKTPEIICNTKRYPELKWIAGFFFWIEEVQGYKSNENFPWTFDEALPSSETTVEDPAFATFVNATSGIVNRGCPSATECPAGVVDKQSTRLENAKKVLNILESHSGDLMSSVQNIQSDFEAVVLKTNGSKQTYDFDSFVTALKFVLNIGFTGKKFRNSKVNLAAFLGQCMQETLQYGACDENNWTGGDPSVLSKAKEICSAATTEEVCNDTKTHPQFSICKWNGNKCEQAIYGFSSVVYPSTAACGQLGQYYKEYKCGESTDSCDPDGLDDRVIVGVTHASWYDAPGPLFADGRGTLGDTVYKWK